MPVCRDCGNNTTFSCSKLPSQTPFTTPPLPLKGSFNSNGSLGTLEYIGTNNSILDSAWQNPKAYFDICGICGSGRIQW